MKPSRKRGNRFKNFTNNYLDIVAFKFDVSLSSNGYFYVIHNTHAGSMDYYPKADKINLHNGGWVDGGLKYIDKYLVSLK